MDNYSLESVPEPDARQRRITRLLLFVWLVLGLIVVGLLCYIGTAAFRMPPAAPAFVGDIDKYPPNSVNLDFINAKFFDDTANKDQETLPLQDVTDPNGN